MGRQSEAESKGATSKMDSAARHRVEQPRASILTRAMIRTRMLRVYEVQDQAVGAGARKNVVISRNGNRQALHFAPSRAKARSERTLGGTAEAVPFPKPSCHRAPDRSLLEGLDCGGLVLFYIENGVELGDLKQVVHLLGEIQKFEFAALILGGGVGADQLANA
jgi:hypothetical protein